MLTALCLAAGFAALAGMASVIAVLIFGLGMSGLLAATGFGVVALVTGVWAALLAFTPPPNLATGA